MEWPRFAGTRRESAEEYIESLQASFLLAPAAADPTNEERATKVQFRRGLRRDAPVWYREEARAEDKTSM